MKKNLYYIDISQNYMITLAKGVVGHFGKLTLPYLTILFPSQRGVLEFQTVFSKISPNSVIPKAINFTDYGMTLLAASRPNLQLNTFSNFDRHFFVAEYLKKALPKQRLSHINELALSITSLWDELTLSGLSKFDVINDLKKNTFSSHFPSLFLDLTTTFHNFLKNQGLLDEKEKLYKILFESTAIIQEHRHFTKKPVILAGTTGTIPAVRQLASALLEDENGYVILPGLPRVFQKLSPYHPFYTQNEWMKKYEGYDIIPFFKDHNISQKIIDIFSHTPPLKSVETEKILYFETSSLYKEALLIALLVRYHLEIDPKKDITIVCGNQYLTQLIQEQLYQFDFFANNSLSLSLLDTSEGKFLQALLNFNLKSSLKNTLSLLKNPFYKKEQRLEHLNKLEELEKNILQDDIQTLGILFSAFPMLQTARENLKNCNNFLSWLEIIEQEIENLSDNFIFQNLEGEHLRKFFDTVKNMPLKLAHISEWTEWIISSLKLYTIDPVGIKQHQKVRLIGTIESRHNSSEIVIVAGLNEGTWPPLPQENIWLNPLQEKELNLPEPTRRLALNSHDFANCLSAERVYLTRAIKIDGKIQEKSRFLRRLELHIKSSKRLLDFKGWIESILHQKTSENIFLESNTAPIFPHNVPLPTKMSISALELLNKDPMSYYIRYILGARERPQWYKGISAANIGQITHKILEEINFNTANCDNIKNRVSQKLFYLDLSIHEKIFIKNQLFNMVNFVVKNTVDQKIITQLREKKTSLCLGNIEIYGIADRIDFLTDCIHLIDYKTGIVPTLKSIQKKESLQMPLLMSMLLRTYEKPLKTSYWKLSGVKNKSQIITLPITHQLCAEHIAWIDELLKKIPWNCKI